MLVDIVVTSDIRVCTKNGPDFSISTDAMVSIEEGSTVVGAHGATWLIGVANCGVHHLDGERVDCEGRLGILVTEKTQVKKKKDTKK